MEELEFPRKECDTQDTSEDIEFQIIDWYIPESDRAVDFYNRRDGYKNGAKPQIYSMYIYGVTEKGESVCCKINDFEPYFYLKAPTSWKNYKEEIQKLTYKLCEEKMERKRFNKSSYISTIIPYRLKEHLVYIKKVKRKDYWGFTNRQEFPFLKVRVKSLSLFNILKRWFGEKEQKEAGWGLYGSNLDPFFRYIHEQKIEPCGWIKLVGDTYTLMSESDDTMSDDSNKEAENISRTNHNICVSYKNVIPCNYNKVAPFLIASFDIECTSSHGDFPVAKKNYKKLASDIISVARYNLDNFKENIGKWIVKAFHEDVVISRDITINKLFIKKNEVKPETISDEIKNTIITIVVSILSNLKNNKRPIIEDNESENSDEEIDEKTEGTLIEYLNKNLPKLKGDPIIQIGTTVSRFGSDEIIYKHLVGLKKTDDIDNIEIESYNKEETVLLKWKEFIQRLDPDILTGYNIFGFDMKYIWERAEELDILDEFSVGLGRMQGRKTILDKKELSSSALGDNVMYYFDMDGVVLIDMFKVMQRDHKLDSYKLDFVANTFLQDKKDDLKPREIFEKYKGSSEDRAVIAKYCIQDCALCNRLMHKLKVLGNNIGMGNVCYVPLSYLFMRGQGIKIFSLVSRECYMKNYIIPTIGGNIDRDAPEVGYEGAIVLDPKCDMYLEDPVTVFDYSSLYPSCMISRNLSHDAFVNDEKYANMEDEGITYETIEYDIYEGVGDKKKSIGKKKCVFAQFQNGEKGILPTILMDLLKNRKITRKKIEYETLTLNDGSEVIGGIAKNDKEEDIEDEEGNIKVSDVETGKVTKVKKTDIVSRKDTYTYFEQAVLDALQLAYKITANSLYGQTGSRFSQIYLKEIAACTTATGREMIYLAKNFMEKEYGVDVVYGDSVMPYTPILLRNKITGEITTKTIDDILNQEWKEYDVFKAGESNRKEKQQIEITDYETWTNKGWSSIKRVIKHKCNKAIYRILTHTGLVDVTEDHSLLSENKEIIKPTEVNIGTKLLSSFPTDLYHYNEINIEKPLKSQIDAQKKYINLLKLGFKNISINYYIDYKLVPIIGNIENGEIVNIKKLYESYDDYVYDLETEEGNFQAGIGNIIVKNTDSIFCKFPLSQIPKEERLQKAIEMGMKAEKAVKAVLPMYQSLAYEKVLFPLILLSKKRYIGNLYEKDPKKYKIKSMGVVLKRRDNAQIVKIIYGGVIDILLNKNDLQGSVEFLQTKLQEMVDGKIDIKDLIISKTLKGSYKDPTKIAHKVLADRMGERDEGNKPMVNDRVPFVYIIPPEGTEIKLQGDRIEHPDYIKEKGLKPDYYFYITNQLLKPLCQLYSLCITRLPNYSFPESYWYQIDEELLGKELYKNDKKRANRIDNMKMNEVTDLLFKEYLDKLTPVKMIKKVVAKRPKIEGKLVLAEINTKYELRIESTLKKRGGGKNPYQYAIDIKLLNGEEEIWKEIYELNGDKMRTLIVGTKKALYHIIQNYEEQVKEIKIVGNKDLIYEWKRIMKMNISRDDAIERRKKAYNDSGEVDEMNRVLDIIELIEFYDIIKYNLQNI
jgi:DNA polymerase elongation subunit (family B)